MSRISGLKRYQIFIKFNGHCAYCGCSMHYSEFQIDHIQPISSFIINGKLNTRSAHNIRNLFPSCKPCNLSKKDLSIEAFRSKIKRSANFLKKYDFLFRLAIRFHTVTITNSTVLFYFEKVQSTSYFAIL